MASKLIATAALGAALAGPAFAQSQPPARQGQQGQNQQQQAMERERLRQQLTQAGFRDAQILDTAYLVQARTHDGSIVLTTINPPNAGSQASGASSGTGGQRGSGPGRAQQ